ncbi:NADPH-dependent FMN reductase [Sphingopyxis sp.]|uniref:NADPH-dependent FMN reductase n=1 Tax=Sphingopyxis sp. TaxID=1908224 RepID=UPI003BA8C5EF
MTVFRITALSGSLRAASTNTALLLDIAARAPDGVTIDLFPIGELPLFNPDLETDLPSATIHFRAAISATDAIIIASPEYAHGISGVLKNALDWLVGCEGFAGKPVLILNAAPRAHHAIAALRETLSTMAAQLVDSLPPIETITPNPQQGN